MKFLIRLLINAVALAAAERLLSGITFEGSPFKLVVVALIFGVVNATISPMLKFLTCPLIVLTLGLFTLVINALMLQLTAWVSRLAGFDFRVESFVSAFLGALVISIVSFILSMVVGDGEAKKES